MHEQIGQVGTVSVHISNEHVFVCSDEDACDSLEPKQAVQLAEMIIEAAGKVMEDNG